MPRRLDTLKLFGGLLASALLTIPALAVDLSDTRLLDDPAISGRSIAFTYAGDLWSAERGGSNVRRLTSSIGTEAAPAFSPDGAWIAFTGEYDGNLDVYLVPSQGGVPRRLTYHPALDRVEGFTPDGKGVLFSSSRHVFTNRYSQLFVVSIDGGLPSQLPIPNGLRAEYSPDGKRIAYIPIAERFFQWKNYRGGTTSRIWIYDTHDHSVVEIPRPPGGSNDTDPTWIGDKVFFRSDRAGELNVFSFDAGDGPTKGTVTQETRFEEFPVLRLAGDGHSLVLENGGFLHLLDPGRPPQRLKIGVAADLVEHRPRWVEGAEWIRDASISPSGARAVFEYRGEILTLPAKKGDARNLTNSTGVHERSPIWSPDGSKIAYFSDEGGEYQLHLAPQDGVGEVRKLAVEGHGFYFDPRWSPDNRKITYTDNSQGLFIVDLESGSSRLIAEEPHYRPGNGGPQHTWSPDSRWVAYAINTDAAIGRVWVYDTQEKKSTPISDGFSDVSDPAFDRGGKYLYFLGSTDAGPVKDWFSMSNADMSATGSLYLAVLRDDLPSPLQPESDEEKGVEEPKDKEKATTAKEAEGSDKKGKKGKDDEGGEKDTAEKAPEPVTIDFANLDQRILSLPLPAGVYADVEAGAAGKIFYRRRSGTSGPQARWELFAYDLEKREETSLLPGADGFSLSADGKKLLFVAGPSWGIADAGGKIDPGPASLAVSKLSVHIDPVAEWRQIFDEAWRINRDYFYDPNYHGADWTAMGEKYEQFLDHLATRDDLNRILRWMSSELSVGHHSVFGGDERDEAKSIPGGLLGADYELEAGRYRFKKIFGGLNWNPELRSPLTEPGVAVKEGEYLLAVNGTDLGSTDNIYSRFENTADKIVTLSVGPNANGTGSRVVTVVPIDSESALRNRAWVEGNLEKVNLATAGRVAYVYVPNTTTLGHTYFKRYFFPQADKQAIIVDERFNGGGQVADYYIDHLRRPYISHWATRYGKDLRTPGAAIFGPKVMLIDETAGSGGDLLPWMFHKLGLGTLVGKRTWGGLVGMLGFPVLLDGGFITAPNLAIWTEDGFVVENVGVPPDIEVEQWPADVIAGRDPQLEKAIEVALQQLEENPPPVFERPPYPIRVRQ